MSDQSNQIVQETNPKPSTLLSSPSKQSDPKQPKSKKKKAESPVRDIDTSIPVELPAFTSDPSNHRSITKPMTLWQDTLPSTQFSKKLVALIQNTNDNSRLELEPQQTGNSLAYDSTIEKRLNQTVEYIPQEYLTYSPEKPSGSTKNTARKKNSKVSLSHLSKDSVHSLRSHSDPRSHILVDSSMQKTPNFDSSIQLPPIQKERGESHDVSSIEFDKKTNKSSRKMRFKNKSHNKRVQADAFVAHNLEAIYGQRQNPRPVVKDLIKLLSREKNKNRSSSDKLQETFKESIAGLADAYFRGSQGTIEERSKAVNSSMLSPSGTNEIEHYVRMTRERYRRNSEYDFDAPFRPDPKQFLKKGKIAKTPMLIKKSLVTPEKPEKSPELENFSPQSNMSPPKLSPVRKESDSVEFKVRHFSQDYRRVQPIPLSFRASQEELKKKEKEMKMRVGSKKHRGGKNKEILSPQTAKAGENDLFYIASNKARGLKADLKLFEGGAVKFGSSPRTELFKEQLEVDSPGPKYNTSIASSLSNRAARICKPIISRGRLYNEIRPAPGQYNIIRDFDLPPGQFGFTSRVVLDKSFENFGSSLFGYNVLKGNTKYGVIAGGKKTDLYGLEESKDLPGPGAYDVKYYPKTRGYSFTTAKRIDMLDLPVVEETNKFYVENTEVC